MRATVEIFKNTNKFYFGIIKIKHNFIISGELRTELNSSKGQLKRQIIQFCGRLNLEVEWV